MDRDISSQSELLKAPSSVALDLPEDEAPNTSQGSLLLALTTRFIVKNLCLMLGSLG